MAYGRYRNGKAGYQPQFAPPSQRFPSEKLRLGSVGGHRPDRYSNIHNRIAQCHAASLGHFPVSASELSSHGSLVTLRFPFFSIVRSYQMPTTHPASSWPSRRPMKLPDPQRLKF